MLTGIHHVQLAMPVGGEEDATVFYEGLLGVPRVPKPPHLEARGGCWFESGTVRIHLGVDEDFSPARKAHPALLVEDLDVMRGRLAQAGVDVVSDQPLAGFVRGYVSDPFGNRIELLAPSEP
jgi:catechol 2,3-dioxygenase-like lactoylglutathione lyase family enzyme